MPAPLPDIVEAKTKHLLAQGYYQREVAEKLGISAKSVERIKARTNEEIKQLAQEYISQSIPLIKSNHTKQLQLSNELVSLIQSTPDRKSYKRLKQLNHKLQLSGISGSDLIKISDKKEMRALQVMGIAPASTPSIIINQLLNKGSMTVLNSKVAGFLADKVEDLTTIDAEYEEID